MGASAGGFEAVMNLLKHLPDNTGMAFVVVLHLDPRHKSKLTELVSRATTLPVREIKDNMPVEPDHVYVLPANLDVILANKRLKLVSRPDSERLHMPIDHFFASLAEEQGSQAIGVVLSGTGSDGTLGLLAIKAEAGITFAEASASAKYFGMPRSAIDAGCVDAVLTPDALAKELVRIARHPFVRPRRHQAPAAEPFPESIDALGKIFFLLNSTREKEAIKNTAIVRVEQLYPFPENELRELMDSYPRLERVVWVQEEPRNMGALTFVGPRLRTVVPRQIPLRYVARPERASTAEGKQTDHMKEQDRIVREALGPLASA